MRRNNDISVGNKSMLLWKHPIDYLVFLEAETPIRKNA